MKVYPIENGKRQAFAFEIENAYIGIRKIEAILEGVTGVSSVHRRKPFSSSSDVHIEFKYHDVDYMVWEPFGDNSRYWIGPKEDENGVDIKEIKEAFEVYKPPLSAKIFGDLVTLKPVRKLLRVS